MTVNPTHVSNLYMLWQLPMKNNPTDEIMDALRYYMKKHGTPPQILLEMSPREVVLPEGMNIVQRAVSLPKNVILVGRIEEDEQRESS